MTDFAVARANMVESQVRPNQVTDRRILDAMSEIPRELFVPGGLRPLAYMDEDIVFATGGPDHTPRHMMAPMPLARLIQLAAVREDDIVLDVGCTTGYSSAILARLAEAVVALECDAALADAAGQIIMELEIDNAVVVSGDLESGYADEGPYDAIVLQGSVPEVPEALFVQLKEGGRLATIIGSADMGEAFLYRKIDGRISRVSEFDAAAPALPGFEKVPEFIF